MMKTKTGTTTFIESFKYSSIIFYFSYCIDSKRKFEYIILTFVNIWDMVQYKKMELQNCYIQRVVSSIN